MALSNENKNFLKLQFLVIRSNEHIRNLFLEGFNKKNNFEWIENQETASNFFKNEKNKDIFSMMNTTQKDLALAGDTSKWDLSLFFLILSNSDIIDKSSLKQIEKIKEVRNKIAHSSDMSLADQVYEKHWTEIENSLINLGLNIKDKENFELIFNSIETKEINDDKNEDYKRRDGKFLSQNNFSRSTELCSKGIDFTFDLSQRKNFFFNENINYYVYLEQLTRKWITNTTSSCLKANGTVHAKLSNEYKSVRKSTANTKPPGLKTSGTGQAKSSNATKSAGKSTANSKPPGLKTSGTGQAKSSNATKSAGNNSKF